MKNRRLYAIVLFAALALVQARVAFAGCFGPEPATSPAAAACCLESTLSDGAQPVLEEMQMVCTQHHCFDPSSIANDVGISMLVGSEVATPSSPPLLRSSLYPPLAASLRLTRSESAHPPHTRLVYVLQRLLI